MIIALSRNWWALLLQGISAALFGLCALLVPGFTLLLLVWLFGFYALSDGVFAIVAGVRAAQRQERWWPTVLGGAAGVLAGLLTLLLPGMTAVVLLYVMAVWAIVIGALEIAAAIRLRHVIEGEALMILNGIVTVAVGVLLIAWPGSGLLALAWAIGAYAIFRGALLIALSLRLRRHHLAG